MSRPPKQAALLAVARQHLLRRGIRHTRIEAICAEARVSKRTFYKYFADKDALAVEVLRELGEAAQARVEAVLSGPQPFEQKLELLMQAKAELAAATSAAFLDEAVDPSTAAGRFVRAAQRGWDQRVRRFYAAARAQGHLRDDLDLDVLMALVPRLRALVVDPGLRRVAPPERLAQTVMSLFFYGVIPRGRRRPVTASDRRRAGPRRPARSGGRAGSRRRQGR